MRVITGDARGRRLQTLEGEEVRPTTDKVKEAMFSVIQFEIPGASVLDLFAGSGQLGIEALSRGASSAVFLDSNPKAISVIEENLQHTGLRDRAVVLRQDSLTYLKLCRQKFDLSFLDPPYHRGLLQETLPYLAPNMHVGGKIICEFEEKLKLDEKISNLVLKKCYRYGKIQVALYEAEEAPGA